MQSIVNDISNQVSCKWCVIMWFRTNEKQLSFSIQLVFKPGEISVCLFVETKFCIQWYDATKSIKISINNWKFDVLVPVKIDNIDL